MDHYTNQEIRYTPAEEAYRDPGYILTAMADFTLYIPSGIELTLEKDIMEHLCWNINAGIRYGFSPRMADGGPTIWPWLTAGLRGYIFERSGLFLGAEAGIQGAYLMPAPMLAAEIGWRLNITKEISAEALVQGELIWMTLNPKIGVSYRF